MPPSSDSFPAKTSASAISLPSLVTLHVTAFEPAGTEIVMTVSVHALFGSPKEKPLVVAAPFEFPGAGVGAVATVISILRDTVCRSPSVVVAIAFSV